MWTTCKDLPTIVPAVLPYELPILPGTSYTEYGWEPLAGPNKETPAMVEQGLQVLNEFRMSPFRDSLSALLVRMPLVGCLGSVGLGGAQARCIITFGG